MVINRWSKYKYKLLNSMCAGVSIRHFSFHQSCLVPYTKFVSISYCFENEKTNAYSFFFLTTKQMHIQKLLLLEERARAFWI